MDDEKRTMFLRSYSNIPLGLRSDIIAIVDPEGPVSWMVAYLEIKNKTPKGDEILDKLWETKIFP
jgi:hypothetical protein